MAAPYQIHLAVILAKKPHGLLSLAIMRGFFNEGFSLSVWFQEEQKLAQSLS
jgi:hypothetical protein